MYLQNRQDMMSILSSKKTSVIQKCEIIFIFIILFFSSMAVFRLTERVKVSDFEGLCNTFI